MLACPNCTSRLRRTVIPKGVIYLCGKCGGRAVGVGVLKRQADPAFMRRLRLAAYGARRRRGRPCPHCRQPMAEVHPGRGTGNLILDVCTRCHVVWFDPQEFAAVPPKDEDAPSAAAPAAGTPHGLGVGAGVSAPATPDSAWKYLPGIMGWPVEMESIPVGRKPVITWGLAVIMALLFLLLASGGELGQAINDWGLIPNQWDRQGGATLLTGFFLHGGVFHLLSNLYFFVIFGDNVEDHLGPNRFILLLAASHVVGTVLHAALDPRGNIPCVGASAGIAGVIAYYAIVFPHARIGFFIWFFLRWLRIRAMWALVLYLILQLWGSWQQVTGFGNVSYLAHVGGLAVGAATALLVRLGRISRRD